MDLRIPYYKGISILEIEWQWLLGLGEVAVGMERGDLFETFLGSIVVEELGSSL